MEAYYSIVCMHFLRGLHRLHLPMQGLLLSGHGNWTTDPEINYSNHLLFSAWEDLVVHSEDQSNAYQYDIANIGRQVLGNYFLTLRDSFYDSLYKQ